MVEIVDIQEQDQGHVHTLVGVKLGRITEGKNDGEMVLVFRCECGQIYPVFGDSDTLELLDETIRQSRREA